MLLDRSLDDFEILELVGEGTYGKVHRAIDKRTRQVVALKEVVLKTAHEGFPVTSIREIKILRRLKHANIINLQGIVAPAPASFHAELRKRADTLPPGTPASRTAPPGPVTSQQQQQQQQPPQSQQNPQQGQQQKDMPSGIHMLFDWMQHDLTGVLQEQNMAKKLFHPSQTKCVMQQLLTGLEFSHRNGIVHRDIKCANLLISHDGILKLADFGLAREFDFVPPDAESFDVPPGYTNKVITLWYRPPELLLGSTQYGPAIDIWSAGCIMGEILMGGALFCTDTEMKVLDRIFNLRGFPVSTPSEAPPPLPDGTPACPVWPGVESLPLWKEAQKLPSAKRKPTDRLRQVLENLPSDAQDLLGGLLAVNPFHRLTAAAALEHPYFRSPPLPCQPRDLPLNKSHSCHELRMKKTFGRSHEFFQNAAQMGAGGQNPAAAPPPASSFEPPSHPQAPSASTATHQPHHAAFEGHQQQIVGDHSAVPQANPLSTRVHTAAEMGEGAGGHVGGGTALHADSWAPPPQPDPGGGQGSTGSSSAVQQGPGFDHHIPYTEGRGNPEIEAKMSFEHQAKRRHI